MKNKKTLSIIVLFSVVVLLALACLFLFCKNNDNSNVPDGYVAVFHGKEGSTIYETYVYKQDNGQGNYGFDYINTTKTFSKKSNEVIFKITKRGSVDWTDSVFAVAKKNNAYSYVTKPNSNQKYTIKQFMDMFLMN